MEWEGKPPLRMPDSLQGEAEESPSEVPDA